MQKSEAAVCTGGRYNDDPCDSKSKDTYDGTEQVCGYEVIESSNPLCNTTPMQCCGYGQAGGSCSQGTYSWWSGYCYKSNADASANYSGTSCGFVASWDFSNQRQTCAKTCKAGYYQYFIGETTTGTCVPVGYTGCGARYSNYNRGMATVSINACPPNYACSGDYLRLGDSLVCNPPGTRCVDGTSCMSGTTCGSSGSPLCYGQFSQLNLSSCGFSSSPTCVSDFERVAESLISWSNQVDAIAPIILGGNTETVGQTLIPQYDGYLTKVVILVYKLPTSGNNSGIRVKIVEHESNNPASPGRVVGDIGSEVDFANVTTLGSATATFPLGTIRLRAGKQYGIVLRNVNSAAGDIYEFLVSTPTAFSPANPSYSYSRGTLAYYRVNPTTQAVSVTSVNSGYDLLFNTYMVPAIPIGTCGENELRILNSLVTSPPTSGQPVSLITTDPSTKCIIDPKTAFAPFKIPTFDDLKSLYYTQAKSSVRRDQVRGSPNQGDFTSVFTRNDVVLVNGDLLDVTYTGTTKPSVIFVEGNLSINNNITYGDANSGLVFVVKGKINIAPAVRQIDAVLISDGIGDGTGESTCTPSSTTGLSCYSICTALDSTGSCPGGLDTATGQTQLVINGSLISLRSNYPIRFRRNLTVAQNVLTPVEKINHQVKYLVILRNLISDTYQKWAEIP